MRISILMFVPILRPLARRLHQPLLLFSTGTFDDPYINLKNTSLKILQADVEYYNMDANPTLSDSEYDSLARTEADIVRKYPDLAARWEVECGMGSQSTRAGGRVGSGEDGEGVNVLRRFGMLPPGLLGGERGGDRVEHVRPMLSLDNAMNEGEVKAWVERVGKSGGEEGVEIVAEPKIDGVR